MQFLEQNVYNEYRIDRIIVIKLYHKNYDILLIFSYYLDLRIFETGKLFKKSIAINVVAHCS